MWVLIMTLYVWSGVGLSTSVSTAEFSSYEQCSAASQAWESSLPDRKHMHVSTLCAHK